mmetsp:Transcript_16391/g.44586  ORF Transcript_16391/g.44586 Transcript_16391/m.44586 type:complete len:205 (+) Transcript_16391:89-703(+)
MRASDRESLHAKTTVSDGRVRAVRPCRARQRLHKRCPRMNDSDKPHKPHISLSPALVALKIPTSLTVSSRRCPRSTHTGRARARHRRAPRTATVRHIRGAAATRGCSLAGGAAPSHTLTAAARAARAWCCRGARSTCCSRGAPQSPPPTGCCPRAPTPRARRPLGWTKSRIPSSQGAAIRSRAGAAGSAGSLSTIAARHPSGFR